jgi:ribosomal protein S18 acetylase RimI-like enzyme
VSNGHVLRAGGAADIDRLLAFWRTSAEDTDREDDRVAVERLLLRDPEALILAVEDDDIVGSVIAGWDGWRWHLYRIAVRQDRRQRGIAAALIAAAEARFAAQGARRVDAMVLEGNTLGQTAWAALGYAPQQQWRRWVRRLDGPVQPAPP